ncbi:glycosyltransferase family 2 protein [Priestia megaterium]|uniref:glycosyltransferase family 2 protein n=1 Tax=Priestia megaterium TaxID=1404 RepID=UPI0012B993D3|nr:glycosyltransferase family 2 protein [Priestia megaterium]
MNGVSLIIPIYNVEEYIEECLQSVVKSMNGLPNIQVILVDDGSQDNSGKIAQEFANQHSNFLYVCKENGGLSDARNFGMNYVEYDFIAFLDSDDYIAAEYFKEVFKVIPSDPDMIIFDWEDVGENNYSNLVKGIDFPDSLWTVQPSAWNKIYKKALFNEVKFPKGKIYEDVGTIYKLLYFVKDYSYISKPLYKYRKNRGGSILSTISPKINDIYEVLDSTYNFYRSKGALSKKNNEGLCYQYVKLLMWSNMYRQLKFYKLNLWGFYNKMKQTRVIINKLFKEWKTNEYINKNKEFFSKRLGNNFIERFDGIGKSFLSTTMIVSFLAFKNKSRF